MYNVAHVPSWLIGSTWCGIGVAEGGVFETGKDLVEGRLHYGRIPPYIRVKIRLLYRARIYSRLGGIFRVIFRGY